MLELLNTAFLEDSGVSAMMVLCNRLHLDHQVAVLSIDILRVEYATVGLEATARLMPASAIECIEVIPPVEFELFQFRIIDISLNIIEEQIPWHVRCVKPGAPRLESRRPKVHSERLSLCDVLDSFDALGRKMADTVAINSERDILRSPLHSVNMPIVMRIEVLSIVVVFNFGMAIAKDHICGHRIVLN